MIRSNNPIRGWLPVIGAVLLFAGWAGFKAPASSARQDPDLSSTVAVLKRNQVRVMTPDGETKISLPLPATDISLSPDGSQLAATMGVPIRYYMGGSRGQVVVVDLESGATSLTTGLTNSILTGLAYNPAGDTVAFVRDYTELWLLDVSSAELRKIADAQMLAPDEPGAVLFDPAFSASGESILVGVVERTFYGEDDRLDNLWTISLAGEAQRTTDLRESPSYEEWTVLRNPIAYGDNGVAVTRGSSDDSFWHAAAVEEGGHIRDIGPVPPFSFLVAASQRHMHFLTMDQASLKFDLIEMETPLDLGWEHWCAAKCSTLASNVDAASVVTHE